MNQPLPQVDLDLVIALIEKYAKGRERSVEGGGSGVGIAALLKGAVDIANARIEFADGCVANVSASRVSQAAVRKLRVFRDDGYSSADLQEQRLREARKGTAGGIEETERTFERVDELEAQAEDFLRAVRERAAPLVGGGEGRAALALADLDRIRVAAEARGGLEEEAHDDDGGDKQRRDEAVHDCGEE